MNSPPPLSPSRNPPARSQRQTDESHLGLLAIFHFVAAGLSIFGIGFLVLNYVFLEAVMSNPEIFATNGQPPPVEFLELFEVFKWFYLAFGIGLVISAVLTLVSGFCIRQRKRRLFSLVIAGLNCIHVPLGTVLGVFTIIVLNRNSVVDLYENVQ